MVAWAGASVRVPLAPDSTKGENPMAQGGIVRGVVAGVVRRTNTKNFLILSTRLILVMRENFTKIIKKGFLGNVPRS